MAIAAGAMAISGAMKARAADKAAGVQAAAYGRSAETNRIAGQEARGLQEQYYGQTRQDFNPYLQAGAIGTQQYLGEMGDNFGIPEFTAPDPEGIYADPSYQWRLNQGIEATTRALTKSGQAWGGQRGIALMDYAQNLASTEYGNIYQRALADYNSRYRARNAYLDRIGGLMEQGRMASTSLGGIGSNYAANIGQTITGTAGRISDAYIGQGASRAAGIMGQAEGYASAVEGIGGMYALGGGTMGGGGTGVWSPGGGTATFQPVGTY